MYDVGNCNMNDTILKRAYYAYNSPVSACRIVLAWVDAGDSGSRHLYTIRAGLSLTKTTTPLLGCHYCIGTPHKKQHEDIRLSVSQCVSGRYLFSSLIVT